MKQTHLSFGCCLAFCCALGLITSHGQTTNAAPGAPTPPPQLPHPAGETAKWTPPNLSLPLPRKLLDFTLQPTAINTSPGPEYDDDAREMDLCGGIERTRGGRLWAVMISGGDDDTGFVVGVKSDDDGKTWSKPAFVIDPFDVPAPRQRVLVSNLWLDPKGRLWLFYDKSFDYFDGRGGVWATICDDPDAAVPQWSAPVRIWNGALINKPVVLSNGEWLAPVSLWQRNAHPDSRVFNANHALDNTRGVNLMVSTDEGKTWARRGPNIDVSKLRWTWDFDEPMIIERKDGSLWMAMRTRNGPCEVTSADRGNTWSAPVLTTFATSNARFFLRRLKSGKILLVKNGEDATKILPVFQRDHMTAFLSDDEGKTWSKGFVLDERASSYPDGTQAPDGRIYVVYDYNRYATPGNPAQILMTTFTEDDVLAGKPVSKDCRLKAVVNTANPDRPAYDMPPTPTPKPSP